MEKHHEIVEWDTPASPEWNGMKEFPHQPSNPLVKMRSPTVNSTATELVVFAGSLLSMQTLALYTPTPNEEASRATSTLVEGAPAAIDPLSDPMVSQGTDASSAQVSPLESGAVAAVQVSTLVPLLEIVNAALVEDPSTALTDKTYGFTTISGVPLPLPTTMLPVMLP